VLPLLQWKSNNYYTFWLCICSLRYAACNAHAPYCHLWPTRLYYIFPNYLINGTIFEKENLLNTNVCFYSLYNLYTKLFYWKKNWARHDYKCTLVFMKCTCYSCRNLIRLEFSRQIFEKFSNIKFKRLLSRSSKFCESAYNGGQIIVVFKAKNSSSEQPYVAMNGRTEVACRFTEYSEYLHLQESMKLHNKEIHKYVYIIH
jgi:hypothetical protein